MMDIVERLRNGVNRYYGKDPAGLLNEASDEIERLREALRQIQGLGDTAYDSWKAYQICCEALGEKND